MSSEPRIVNLQISRSNIDAQIIALLYATKAISHKADILSIGYDAAAFIANKEIVPVRVVLKEEQTPTDQVAQ